MFQEDKDMADQNEAKTKTIGFLPVEKVQTLNGWDEYADKSTKLSVLRTETQKAKNSVRDALKDTLVGPDFVRIEFVIDAHAHDMVRDAGIEIDSKRCRIRWQARGGRNLTKVEIK